MTEPTISYAAENFEDVFLVGVRLQPAPHELIVYALVLYYEVARGDKNRPLTSEGRIVFFRDVTQATRILGLGDAAFRKYGKAPAQLAYLYDLSDVLARVRYQEIDEQASLLNALNELADFVAATDQAMPERHQQVLTRLADWLTFDQNYSDFFAAHGVARGEIVDALLWSIGAVASKALVVG